MADYRLTQTGAQVQDALNQVPTLTEQMLLKYTKPVNGIPDSDLTEALQLAIQGHFGIPEAIGRYSIYRYG